MAVYRSRDMLSDKKDELSGRRFGECPLLKHHTTSLIFNDPPYHTVVRKLITGAFTPRKLDRDGEPHRRNRRSSAGPRGGDAGELDLISGFAMTLPTEIISFMLGIPEAVPRQACAATRSLSSARSTPSCRRSALPLATQAVESNSAPSCSELIDHRRRNPEGAGAGRGPRQSDLRRNRRPPSDR